MKSDLAFIAAQVWLAGSVVAAGNNVKWCVMVGMGIVFTVAQCLV
jgi:hypothetical protein